MRERRRKRDRISLVMPRIITVSIARHFMERHVGWAFRWLPSKYWNETLFPVADQWHRSFSWWQTQTTHTHTQNKWTEKGNKPVNVDLAIKIKSKTNVEWIVNKSPQYSQLYFDTKDANDSYISYFLRRRYCCCWCCRCCCFFVLVYHYFLYFSSVAYSNEEVGVIHAYFIAGKA